MLEGAGFVSVLSCFAAAIVCILTFVNCLLSSWCLLGLVWLFELFVVGFDCCFVVLRLCDIVLLYVLGCLLDVFAFVDGAVSLLFVLFCVVCI